jgi:NADPH-dependent glutamate synthase beta subunit-like oxidoreductase
MWHTAKNDISRSSFMSTFLLTIHFPRSPEWCATTCVRTNVPGSHYDEPVQIREVKALCCRKLSSQDERTSNCPEIKKCGVKVAVIGAGPAGLSYAWYMNLAGFEVDVYETENLSRRNGFRRHTGSFQAHRS